MSRYLRLFLVAFGALMILGGMWYFDIYANFVGRAQSGDLDSFFICRDYPADLSDFPTDGYPPCWMDFFEGYMLNITAPVIAFQAVAVVLVVLGLTWNRLSNSQRAANKIKEG